MDLFVVDYYHNNIKHQQFDISPLSIVIIILVFIHMTYFPNCNIQSAYCSDLRLSMVSVESGVFLNEMVTPHW